MSELVVRVNGRGNAWPVFVGGEHPFYEKTSLDLSNASYSMISYRAQGLHTKNIEWSVLVDAGNHTVPYIVQHENRIPEAIFITHAHLDHTLGIDWIAQSYYYTNNRSKSYPVYCTALTFQLILSFYPHLKNIIVHKELLPGTTRKVDEVKNLKVTPYPVYHGSSGLGACMLLFDIQKEDIDTSVLFSGDMICPLMCDSDYNQLSRAKTVYIDTNNRFPYPATNHGSFTSYNKEGQISDFLSSWKKNIRVDDLIKPHTEQKKEAQMDTYVSSFIKEQLKTDNLPCSVLDFLEKTGIPHAHLVHYSGKEDRDFYQEKILTDKQLAEWAQNEAQLRGLNSVEIRVPKVGEIFKL